MKMSVPEVYRLLEKAWAEVMDLQAESWINSSHKAAHEARERAVSTVVDGITDHLNQTYIEVPERFISVLLQADNESAGASPQERQEAVTAAMLYVAP